MDTLTHGLLGGVVVRAAFGKKATAPMVLAGTIGAMTPDIDVFIRSKADPLLFWTLHRHFTHSLLFVPIGALFIALLFWLFRRKTSFKDFYFASLLGYLTHPFLDAATSFGTLLYWPFSHDRVSWDLIAVIDPIVTLVLLVGLIFAFRSGGRRGASVSLVLFFLYLSFGIYQHQLGKGFQKEVTQNRGHSWVQGRVMPTLGNLMVWRSVYKSEDKLWIDAFRLIPGKTPRLFGGGEITEFKIKKQTPTLPPASMVYRDIERFTWFAEGYVGILKSQNKEWQIGDMRYSAISQGEIPIWGIEFSERETNQHVQVIRFPRHYKSSLKALGNLLFNGK